MINNRTDARKTDVNLLNVNVDVDVGDQINLRESINSLNRFLPLVSENVSKAVHELYVGSRADKHAASYIGSTIPLMLQADLLQ